jgi:hypothetical protein
MTRTRRLLFPEVPAWAGVRIGGVILFDDAISIRWGQLRPEYRIGGSEPWLLLDYAWGAINWTLTDDVGTIYHPIAQSASHGGFFTHPYWNGEQAFAPRVPNHAAELRMSLEQKTAVLKL